MSRRQALSVLLVLSVLVTSSRRHCAGKRRGTYACDSHKDRIMRRSSGNALVAGLCAAAGSLSAVDGTRAFEAGAWEVARGGQDCHRSFPAFLWGGSNTGGKLEVCVHMHVCVFCCPV